MKKPPVTLIFLLLICTVYFVGALCSAWIYQEWNGTGGWIEANLLRKGPHRLMSRMSMICLVLLLPLILRWIRWQGWSDCGWALAPSSEKTNTFLREMGRGAALAAVTMLPALLLMLMTGGRRLDPEATVSGLISLAISAGISALLIGLIEETLARGVIFRALSRCWTPWRAVLSLSLTFALVHFIRPSESAFEADSILSATLSALGSMPGVLLETADVLIRTLNLTLMSVALCVMVMRRGNIWMAVGAHAAWVWMKKVYGYLTNSVREPGDIAQFLGQKTDSTDSLIASLLLGLLLAYLLLSCRDPRQPKSD